MTEVSYVNDGGRIVFTVKGHAEYAAEGADIVCAACSALSGTLATKIANLPVKSNISFESGNLKLVLERKDIGPYLLEIMHAFDFAMMGYRLLEEQYPSNVIVTAW